MIFKFKIAVRSGKNNYEKLHRRYCYYIVH